MLGVKKNKTNIQIYKKKNKMFKISIILVAVCVAINGLPQQAGGKIRVLFN